MGLGNSFPPLPHTDLEQVAESDRQRAGPMGALAAVAPASGKLCSHYADQNRQGPLRVSSLWVKAKCLEPSFAAVFQEEGSRGSR